jgi:S1-C subfamily serine protease
MVRLPFVSLLVVALAAGVALAQRQATSGRAAERARIRSAADAVGELLVRLGGGELRRRGSAVVVGAERVVITNAHVVLQDNKPEPYAEILLRLGSPNREYELELVALDAELDLAALRVRAAPGVPDPVQQLHSIELAELASLQLLDDLYVIGFPEMGGDSVTINAGVVEGFDKARGWIRTDARLIHGNSGGAAVDNDGRLVGIPTRVLLDTAKGSAGGGQHALGGVGYLRSAEAVATILARLAVPGAADPARFAISGVVVSKTTGLPIAGARVGIVAREAPAISADALLAWAGSNGQGLFTLNNALPSGRYRLRARALGYQSVEFEIEVSAAVPRLLIELLPVN